MNYWLFILACLYLMLPAYLANMAPVIVQRLKWLEMLNRPIDGGQKLGGQDLFGASKTWRGLLVSALTGLLVTALQASFQSWHWLEPIRLLDYLSLNFIVLGLLFGLGALAGDLLKSFFKRRLKIAAGQPWPLFDQLDFVVGSWLLTSLMVGWPAAVVWTVIIITLVGHPLTNMLGYLLKIKKVWW